MYAGAPGVLVFSKAFDDKFRSLGNYTDVDQKKYYNYKGCRYEQNCFYTYCHFSFLLFS